MAIVPRGPQVSNLTYPIAIRICMAHHAMCRAYVGLITPNNLNPNS